MNKEFLETFTKLISTTNLLYCDKVSDITLAGSGFRSVSLYSDFSYEEYRGKIFKYSDILALELEVFSNILNNLSEEIKNKQYENLENMFEEANKMYKESKIIKKNVNQKD